MDHLLLSEITIVSKDIVIISVKLGNTIFVHANQSSSTIDIRDMVTGTSSSTVEK